MLPRIPGMQPVVWSSLLQAGLQLPFASVYHENEFSGTSHSCRLERKMITINSLENWMVCLDGGDSVFVGRIFVGPFSRYFHFKTWGNDPNLDEYVFYQYLGVKPHHL